MKLLVLHSKNLDMNYIITGKNYTSPLINKFKDDKNVIVLTDRELQESDIRFTNDDKIYCPDETSVPFVNERLPKYSFDKLETVKNKYQCRIILKDLFPEFYFKSVNLDQLAKVQLPKGKKFIIKPQKGFFGVGVREITSNDDLSKVAYEIKKQIDENIKMFSEEVFTAEEFIIEEFIYGEEYSFDVFYDEQGEPVLTSFCRHPLPEHKEYFHLLYYTGKEIYETFKEQILSIFREFNKTMKMKNMPLHSEFKEYKGKLYPIEFNVPRFGGYALADLPYYAFGENPFEHYFNGTRPDWENIFATEDKKYGWVLCYNGTNVDVENSEPDYNKLQKDLGEVLHLSKLDYTKNPVFALAYIKLQNDKEIERILSLDFNDYFTPKN